MRRKKSRAKHQECERSSKRRSKTAWRRSRRHEFAAGCIIQQNQEQQFIDLLKKQFEVEMVKFE